MDGACLGSPTRSLRPAGCRKRWLLALYPPECQPPGAAPAILMLARRHGEPGPSPSCLACRPSPRTRGAVLDAQGFIPLTISFIHGQRAGALPGPLRDSFDRMLIARAMHDDKVFAPRTAGVHFRPLLTRPAPGVVDIAEYSRSLIRESAVVNCLSVWHGFVVIFLHSSLVLGNCTNGRK